MLAPPLRLAHLPHDVAAAISVAAGQPRRVSRLVAAQHSFAVSLCAVPSAFWRCEHQLVGFFSQPAAKAVRLLLAVDRSPTRAASARSPPAPPLRRRHQSLRQPVAFSL